MQEVQQANWSSAFVVVIDLYDMIYQALLLFSLTINNAMSCSLFETGIQNHFHLFEQISGLHHLPAQLHRGQRRLRLHAASLLQTVGL